MIEDLSYQPSKNRFKKDYQIKQFINPYFSRERKSKFNTVLYLRVLLAIFIIYLVIYSDLFKVRNIEISGNNIISGDEIKKAVNDNLKQYRFFILPQKNLLFFSRQDLANELNRKFSLNKLEVKRNWQKLDIAIEEKISYLIVYNGKKFYFTDPEGLITRELSEDEVKNYGEKFPIFNVSQENINIADRMLSSKMIKYILDIDGYLKASGLAIRGYESRGAGEVTLVAQPDWRAYFDVNSDPKQAVDNLNLILKEKVPDRSKLNYVDLRLGDKVFLR